MLRLGCKNARCSRDDGGRGQQAGCSRVRRDTYILEDPRQSKKVCLRIESESKSIEVQIRFCNGLRPQRGAEQRHVRPLIRPYLGGNLRRKNLRRIVEVHNLTASRLATSRRIRAISLTAYADAKSFDPPAVESIGVKLGFKILEVQGKFEHFDFSRSLSLGWSDPRHRK